MPCVLIVDDNRDSLAIMEVMLALDGYDTMRASNVQEALEQMRQHRQCLVLLDLIMPLMDGYESGSGSARIPPGRSPADN